MTRSILSISLGSYRQVPPSCPPTTMTTGDGVRREHGSGMNPPTHAARPHEPARQAGISHLAGSSWKPK